VLFTDGFDVLFSDGIDNMRANFLKLGAPLLFSGECA
jgi:hypothetical protein